MLHEAFVSKTKAATFKTVLFAVSLKDKIDPHILLRMETKLDRLLENSYVGCSTARNPASGHMDQMKFLRISLLA
jgi:hypothetical protein